jgi:hypothetical protein
MKSNKSVPFFPFLFFALIAFSTASAQTSTNSPYSRYGLGEVNSRGNGQSFGMGGTLIGMQNDTVPHFFINSTNPASLPYTRLTAIELGINYNRLTLENATQKSTVNTASLGYLSLSFPIYNWWGSTLGLLPYSSVGYNISDEREIPGVGTVDYIYDGSGGINQLYFGNGFRPFYGLPRRFAASQKFADLKNAKDFATLNRLMKRKKTLQGLSIGANVSYLFGNFENTRRSIFDPAGNYFNTRTAVTTRVSDIYLDYGAQFSFYIDSMKRRDPNDSINHRRIRQDLKENIKITLGATFSAQTDIKARIDTMSVNFFYNSIGNEIVRDTIQLTENTRGTMRLPLSVGFGASIRKGDRLTLGADFLMQNWSSFQAFDKNPGLKNSMRVSIGGQYVPNSKKFGTTTDYFKRVHYRLGARYSQTALELKNTQLTEYAVSAGFGFPVGTSFTMRNFSMVNIGVEYGSRGTLTNGLIREKFVKINVGFTINDRWFRKSQFD